MGEPLRYPEHTLILSRQLLRNMLAESRRASPYVHSDITSNQFGKFAPVKTFKKETPIVVKYFRFDNQHIGDSGRNCNHFEFFNQVRCGNASSFGNFPILHPIRITASTRKRLNPNSSLGRLTLVGARFIEGALKNQ